LWLLSLEHFFHFLKHSLILEVYVL
jgi:hypothetical protein